MQILTETEYEELVEETVTRVWGPLGDDQDFVLEIADLVDEGRQEEARAKLRARTHDKVAGAAKYLTDGRIGWLDDLPPTMHGCIVQHADRTLSSGRRDAVAEMHGRWGRDTDPEATLAREAFMALYADVRAEVWRRARSFVNDD